MNSAAFPPEIASRLIAPHLRGRSDKQFFLAPLCFPVLWGAHTASTTL